MMAEDLLALRAQIESFEQIDVISDEIREIVETHMPDLVDRLPRK